MGIANLFRPRYRHSDAAVRADAVRQLDSDAADLLAQIAREDGDPVVRQVAIERLSDPVLLARIAAAESEPEVARLARSRAGERWVVQAAAAAGAADAAEALAQLRQLGDERALAELARRAGASEVRRAALAQVSDPRMLVEVARGAADPAMRLAALERIGDTDLLRGIAVDEQRKELGLAALERIEEVAVLEVVAAKAKHKAVRARAKKLLGARSDGTARPEPGQTAAAAGEAAGEAGARSQEQQRHAERVQLCNELEALAGGDEWTRSPRRAEALEARWVELGQGRDERLAQRFARAATRYASRLAEYREAIARAAAQAEKQQTEAERRAAIQAEKAQAEAERRAAAGQARRTTSPPPVQPRAEGTAGGAAEAAGAAVEGPGVEVAAATGAASQASTAGGAATEESAARRQANLEALRRLVEQITQRDAPEQLAKARTVERKLAQADERFAAIGELPAGPERDELLARFREARRAMFIRLQELREVDDWKRWANVPKQEQLIAEVKALLGEADGKQLGERLHQLQMAWKELGPGPRDKGQELWKQFKAACDEVYARVVQYRAQQNEQMAENLARKEALCQEVEQLADSTDWQATAERIKRLQGEWRQIGPVPRKQADAVWKRFRGACDRFFARRKPHLEKQLSERLDNQNAKEALCAEAEALAGAAWRALGEPGPVGADAASGATGAAAPGPGAEEAEAAASGTDAAEPGAAAAAEPFDWDALGERLKEMRREWRRIGPVPQKEMSRLGERFHQATERLASARERQRISLGESRRAALAAAMADLAMLLDGGAADGARIAAATAALRAAVRELESARLPLDGSVSERLQGLILRAVEVDPAAFRGTDLDPEISSKRKEKLCQRVEGLLPDEKLAADGDATSAADLAERLRAALAQNALGVARANQAHSLEVVREAQEAWRRLGPVPGTHGVELEHRFRHACDRVLSAAQ
jgi:hypothetical protein